MHYPTRPVDKDKAEGELVVNIKKATSPEESAPKQKHVRSLWYLPLVLLYKSNLKFAHHFLPPPRIRVISRLKECIVFTWDYRSSITFWNGLRVQPILSDEVQTFKALITVHKVLQEGHPVVRYRIAFSLVDLMNIDAMGCRQLKKLMDRLHGWKLVLER